MSRRKFIPAAASAAAGAVLTMGNIRKTHAQAKRHSAENPGLPLPKKICPVIDCHLHSPSTSIGKLQQWYPVQTTTEDFVHYLNRCGVDYGVAASVRGVEGKEKNDFIQANRESLALAAQYPNRFIPACLVNGRFPQESVRELIEHRTKHGVFWVGELAGYMTDFTYDTPGFKKIMDTIAEYDMICHIHARTEQIEQLVRDYRQVTFILPHFTPVKKRIFSRIAFVKENKNVYLDISGVSFSRMGILEYAVKEIGADRVLFGSDYTVNDPASVIVRVLNAELPTEIKKQVLFHNAKELIAKYDKAKKFTPFLR